jgi:uncharacterized protein YdhG (YjbR/CyaY superfamily)
MMQSGLFIAKRNSHAARGDDRILVEINSARDSQRLFKGHIGDLTAAQSDHAIKAAAPDATERISYQMPTFYLEGNLVHFAALKNHIGFYPTPSGVQAFIKETAKYASTKGAIQFPLDKRLPLKLVSKIVKFRVKENLQRAKLKSKKRK